MKRLLIALILTSLGGTTAQAQRVNPAIYEFTATSASKGLLGYFDIAASQFNGSAIQVIDNANLLSVRFIDPFNGLVIDTVGPAGYGTFFDSTSGTPRVTAGFGYQGLGNNGNQYDSLSIITSSQVLFYVGGQLNDVTFITSGGPSAVPEPATWAMTVLGFGAMGFAARRRQKVATRASYATSPLLRA